MAATRSSSDNAVDASETFPRSIGQPATRALAQIGITRLDQLTAMSEKELLALHGVGSKAVRILRELLEASGRSFRRE